MEKCRLHPKQLKASPETLSWEPLPDSAQSQHLTWYRFAFKWMLAQLLSGRIKLMYHFGWGPCLCDTENPPWLIRFLLYICFVSLLSVPQFLFFPMAKRVLIPKWWQELSVSLFDSVSLISWCERSNMITKACPSIQAIGISVQLLFALPEKQLFRNILERKENRLDGEQSGIQID